MCVVSCRGGGNAAFAVSNVGRECEGTGNSYRQSAVSDCVKLVYVHSGTTGNHAEYR